ncbi:unnamed protein product [Cochlearia groenlandica]
MLCQAQNVMFITADNGFNKFLERVRQDGHTTILVSLNEESQKSSIAVNKEAMYEWKWRTEVLCVTKANTKRGVQKG